MIYIWSVAKSIGTPETTVEGVGAKSVSKGVAKSIGTPETTVEGVS